MSDEKKIKPTDEEKAWLLGVASADESDDFPAVTGSRRGRASALQRIPKEGILTSDMNERPEDFREIACPVDKHPCEGQGTDAECAKCNVSTKLVALRTRHCDYTNGIAEAIGPDRLIRDTGEPARSDRSEIEALKRNCVLLKIRLEDLKMALGMDAVGWFNRAQAAEHQRDLLRAVLTNIADGDCFCESELKRCSTCDARKALSEIKA